jgi:hypothetical protein
MESVALTITTFVAAALVALQVMLAAVSMRSAIERAPLRSRKALKSAMRSDYAAIASDGTSAEALAIALHQLDHVQFLKIGDLEEQLGARRPRLLFLADSLFDTRGQPYSFRAPLLHLAHTLANKRAALLVNFSAGPETSDDADQRLDAYLQVASAAVTAKLRRLLLRQSGAARPANQLREEWLVRRGRLPW